MAYFVYILYSAKLNKYYVGYTEDLVVRLKQHNEGFSRYTSKANDWEIKYQKLFVTREECMKRERQIKSMKSRKYIEELIAKG